ncbi:MAG: lantibiotic ABC transporter [Candidatus Infernicultor aquiphilus]|uniref:Lantibiotic ABC transporter n=1 Tax=Candidatus Infernicultor aquiphilus TaxID=1805029 RepID=A0A1J5GKM1_9BACT|nr:BtrH N-terminal domain-containing protein [bacterium]OIP69167.1 MAG: lantibiotic ABC transporter [Candidatus Atribacteria bacterium CG2_30_33_13]PIW12522.1 MAG: lantibiotic ABC transporter [Candidatus Atribacteria bacterium CG17_big_fil_post_rev_8_21_14_2_50_34_11]PIX33721.1 MAG: lantibiotic ABC transporter [Candidatus Atribacteria bacterium CG_4_8_14_3_um_filter_34_18]PIY33375.1 MAG: lantibiotic ABC transporter [Candidatus Atribacteria bacterium CG_4_10_14_3_um_filter_34_13]PJB57556.1 MAG:
MIINNFKPFNGQHCETTATGSLLQHLGIYFSEPLLFGLGGGLSFIIWNRKTMDFPFIGGRIKTDLLTQNITRHLNLKFKVQETSSVKKAWENVKEKIDLGIPVGIKLDSYYLDYFTKKFYFAGHYVAMYGYDENNAYLVDTIQQGGLVKTSLKNLELARNEKGPMSSKNLSYTFQTTNKKYDLKKEIMQAISDNAKNYLNPPIENISYKGILKASKEIIKWFKRSKDVEGDFKTTAMLMEKAGTGGALFRNLYRDFLKESYQLLKVEEIKKAYGLFVNIAQLWRTVSKLFMKAGDKKDMVYVNKASDVLAEISHQEKEAMSILLKIGQEIILQQV